MIGLVDVLYSLIEDVMMVHVATITGTAKYFVGSAIVYNSSDWPVRDNVIVHDYREIVFVAC